MDQVCYFGKCSFRSKGWSGEWFLDLLCACSEWKKTISYQPLGKKVLLAAPYAHLPSSVQAGCLLTEKNNNMFAVLHADPGLIQPIFIHEHEESTSATPSEQYVGWGNIINLSSLRINIFHPCQHLNLNNQSVLGKFGDPKKTASQKLQRIVLGNNNSLRGRISSEAACRRRSSAGGEGSGCSPLGQETKSS